MDSQFNTLTRSYHDNFLQYKLTGNQKYKVAYEAAQSGLDAIVVAKNQANETDSQNIKNTLGSDAENKMKDAKSQAVHLGQGLVDEHDEEVAAEMRNSVISAPTTVNPIFQYVAIGIMLATIVGLTLV
jgi:hypothetical protein